MRILFSRSSSRGPLDSRCPWPPAGPGKCDVPASTPSGGPSSGSGGPPGTVFLQRSQLARRRENPKGQGDFRLMIELVAGAAAVLAADRDGYLSAQAAGG